MIDKPSSKPPGRPPTDPPSPSPAQTDPALAPLLGQERQIPTKSRRQAMTEIRQMLAQRGLRVQDIDVIAADVENIVWGT
jgi:hypothetical protein